MLESVEALVTARVPMPAGYVYRTGSRLSALAATLRPGGETLDAPCLAWIARHPDAGTILIDTGFHPDACESARKDFGLPLSLIFGRLRPVAPFDEQLRAAGVDPGAVEQVVMTHLHADHTSAMRLLPNATFVVSRAEWAGAHARGAAAKGFVAKHLPAEDRVRQVEPGEPFGPFAHTLDLLGDGSVRLLSTPGHTPGHVSVLLTPASGRPVLAAGDAAYTRRAIAEGVLPLLTDDDAQARRSLADLKAFAGEHPDAVIVPTHDPSAYADVQHA